MKADTAGRKELFSQQVRSLRIFQALLSWLEESTDKEISRDEVLARLATFFPNEKLDRFFDTLVGFGRYAELLAYDAKVGRLTLPIAESPEPPDESGGDPSEEPNPPDSTE